MQSVKKEFIYETRLFIVFRKNTCISNINNYCISHSDELNEKLIKKRLNDLYKLNDIDYRLKCLTKN